MVQRQEPPKADLQLGRALGTPCNNRLSQHLVLPEGGMVDGFPAHHHPPPHELHTNAHPIICIYLAIWYP